MTLVPLFTASSGTSHLGFTPCRADGHVWMIVDVDKFELGATFDDRLPKSESYYEYVSIHVYDLMVARCKSEQVMQAIINTYGFNK